MPRLVFIVAPWLRPGARGGSILLRGPSLRAARLGTAGCTREPYTGSGVSANMARPVFQRGVLLMDAEEEITTSRRRRPAVMSDVGRLAGVSHQTVSRV